MKDVFFKGCKTLGVNFSTCRDFLFCVNFENCLLDYSSFCNKKMSKIKFVDCSLKEVNFAGADLTEAQFKNSNLLGALFNSTLLKGADFTTSYNYNIDPELNIIKRAKFLLSGVPGLLSKYDIIIE
jgi:uncharacterized protein YjbI with pentapeptide repeats